MEVGPDSISAQVNGLTEGVLYTVRVIATNGEGDSPPSEDAIGRPQPQSPRLVSAVVSGQTLTLRYNRPLDTNSVPAKSAFVVTAGLGLREVGSVSGMEVTLTLAEAVTSVHTVHATYVAPTDASASFLRDLDGNNVYALGGNLSSVTNETDPALLQPLTAQFTNVPSSHDGEDSFTEFSESVWVDVSLGKDHLLRVTGGTVTAGSAAFTFELRFSEEPASGFSYTTVRDHAFTVTDGSVSNVRRLEPGKNVRWEITVTPSSDADCSAEGAICNADGGKLSGGLTLVVPGPQENSAGRRAGG